MSFIQLQAVSRDFPSGDTVFCALAEIDLAIARGEYLAIMGASGSGKSTLMNILGCLDRPTRGCYRVDGRDTARLDPDELASLRRDQFGFVFQRYNLLSDLGALANVEVPAIYAAQPRRARHERAGHLLTQLGLGERQHHRPSQLSGGQQQRVSMARALMNGGELILADEPTGALDSHAGEEVLEILEQLNRHGHTIVLVTHDPKVAAHADRIIELRDGRIVGDGPSLTPRSHPRNLVSRSARHEDPLAPTHPPLEARRLVDWQARVSEALRMALLSMRARRMRTFLTTLGITIGIVSVSCVVALGAGGQEKILREIQSIGTNTLDIYTGQYQGDEHARAIQTLVPADAEAIASLPNIDSVTPMVSTSGTLRYGDVSVSVSLNGVGKGYFRVKGMQLSAGRSFSGAEVEDLAQVIVLDEQGSQRLFPGDPDPIGKIVLVGAVPFRVIGIARARGEEWLSGGGIEAWAPYSSVMGRMLGQQYLSEIIARVSDRSAPDLVASSVQKLLSLRHGRKDFVIENADRIRKAWQASTQVLTLVVSSIAFISLIVGGIGVMNIMLVSVTERTREIGVRAAVGARQRDIRQQFLIEAILICLLGGTMGIVLALLLGLIMRPFLEHQFPMIFSTASIVAAMAVSMAVGLASGYLPARKAAQLDPVEALARE